MNMQLLKQYALNFRKTTTGLCYDANGSFLGTYISMFDSLSDVEDLLNDIELALSGNISQVEDAFYVIDLAGDAAIGEITPTEFILDGAPDTIIPLIDMKEILLSWKEFLMS